MEVESERRSPLLCADGDGNDEGVASSHMSSAPHTRQLLEQFDRSVKFANENVSSEAYHSTDVRFGADLSLYFAILGHIFAFTFLFDARMLIALSRPATSVSEVQDSSARDEGSTRHGTADVNLCPLHSNLSNSCFFPNCLQSPSIRCHGLHSSGTGRRRWHAASDRFIAFLAEEIVQT